MKPITVLLAENHTIVREGFRKLLDLEVVGEAQVQQGSTLFSSCLSDRFQRPSLDRAGRLHKKVSRLTPREREVLQLIAEGKANKQTAAELGIDIKTVEKRREHLMQKLNIHDTAGLTRYAIGAGIIECSVPLTFVQTAVKTRRI